jgi:hypothetical protein
MNMRSFTLVAAGILLAGLPMAAQRQTPRTPPVIAPRPPAPAPPSQPPQPAALSVPDPFAGLRPGPRDLYRLPDGSDRFRHFGRHPGGPGGIGPIYPGAYFPGPFDYSSPYYGSPYYYGSSYSDFTIADTYRAVMAETYRQRQQQEPARGGLVLENLPDAAQVFVDGNYVGLAEEFRSNGHELDLRAGTHNIELRAPGYNLLTFNVMIEPNRIVRYRGEMQAASPKPAVAIAPSQPAVAKNLYVIPNCYAGDKPPSATLPKGCDRKNLQTRK